MSQGVEIIGRGMSRAEELDKVLVELFDLIDTDLLVINPDLDIHEEYEVNMAIEKARVTYEEGVD